MPLATSRVTSQGQVSIPASVRTKLGIGPGSILEWEEVSDNMTVRRVGKYSSSDVHRALFGEDTPAAQSLSTLKEGVNKYIRNKHARR